ncbi:hypothetical protein GJU39_11170 [Pedobacter petrophilus]|uniref:Uncharacterized protein n=1 Tax=Pedobacter petrophilus TaxID=1908241 RepID=A0A7K0FYI6_9SPHI|nr:hypothetical protein [Pedobacter petrophilus]MRX76653.1 hypothetical protein [Pedobacter petrophilus]
MRKNSILLKRYVLALTLLLTTTIVIYSCKKDSNSRLPTLDEVAETKAWFINEVKNNKDHIVSEFGDSALITYEPIWSQLKIDELKDDLLVITMPVNTNLYQLAGKIGELNLIIRNNNGIRNYKLVNRFKDGISDTIKLNSIQLYELAFSNFKESFINKNQIKNYISNETLSLNKLRLSKLQSIGKIKDKLMSATECWAYYWTTTYSDGSQSVEYLFTSCSSPGHKPTLLTKAYDPGGDGTEKNTNSDIQNKTTDPCINATVQAALDANKDVIGMIGGIISLFDASKKVRLNIYDGTTEHGTAGQYKDGGFVGNIFQANITLQTSNFKNSSKESVITTLIHESVHAYLHASGSKILEGDHETISKKYIDPMATYLRNYFGMDIKDSYSLAWSGLADSRAYIDAKSTDSFTMSNGNVIMKDEIGSIAGAYAINGEYYADQKKRGTPICN